VYDASPLVVSLVANVNMKDEMLESKPRSAVWVLEKECEKYKVYCSNKKSCADWRITPWDNDAAHQHVCWIFVSGGAPHAAHFSRLDITVADAAKELHAAIEFAGILGKPTFSASGSSLYTYDYTKRHNTCHERETLLSETLKKKDADMAMIVCTFM
jgi:hypothetical protein